MIWLWVALGGALGSAARFGLGDWAARTWGVAFPWGTLAINVIGSFVIGFAARLTLPGGPLPASLEMRAFIMVGVCGGFTTFSAFSLQTLELIEGGHAPRAAAYIVASVVLCVLAVFIGVALAGRLGR